MTSQLPDGAARHSAWLREASNEQLAQALSEQAARDPGLLVELADALDAAEHETAWAVELLLGKSFDHEADFVEVPLDEESFLQSVLGRASLPDDAPTLLRLNVRPTGRGSDLDVDLILPDAPRPGVRIVCRYDLDVDDVLLEAESDGVRLVGRSSTARTLTGSDAVSLRLVVEQEGDAVA